MNCKQTKCCFNGTNLCPKCRGCGSPANIVDGNCVDCWNCENDNGYIRGSINLGKKEDVKVNMKEEEKLMEIK